MIPVKGRGPDLRLGGAVCYTARLRLRVTKQRTQRVGKLLISNLSTAAGAWGRRRQVRFGVRFCQDVAVDRNRYYSLSLPDMMSK